MCDNQLGSYWTSSGPYDEIFYYIESNTDAVRDDLALMITGSARKETSLGYVHRLAKESARMLKATKALDTRTMTEILEYAHNTESPLVNYSNEAELAAVIRLVYLAARDTYRVEQEDKAGIGYVDFIFYPLQKGDDCIILELKVNHTADEVIRQIKNRRYALRFQGKLGDPSR